MRFVDGGGVHASLLVNSYVMPPHAASFSSRVFAICQGASGFGVDDVGVDGGGVQPAVLVLVEADIPLRSPRRRLTGCEEQRHLRSAANHRRCAVSLFFLFHDMSCRVM